MRPTYESESDRQREDSVALLIGSAWGVAVGRRQAFAAIDRRIYGHGLVLGFIEIKCRRHRFGTYADFLLSRAKWIEGCSLSERQRLPVALGVSWLCGRIGWRLIDTLDLPMSYGGRRDRADPRDEETLVHIPLDSFFALETIPDFIRGGRDALA